MSEKVLDTDNDQEPIPSLGDVEEAGTLTAGGTTHQVYMHPLSKKLYVYAWDTLVPYEIVKTMLFSTE